MIILVTHFNFKTNIFPRFLNMEAVYTSLYSVLECPNIKLKKPSWIRMPSPMFVFSMILLSYFLVTGMFFLVYLYIFKFKAYLFTGGIIYDIIVEPPSIGSTTDEKGNSKPVAFMAYRVNGQYIMEGLASSFMFSLGALGFILLDQTNKPTMPKLTRIMFLGVSIGSILIAFFMCRLFMRIKLPGYLLG